MTRQKIIDAAIVLFNEDLSAPLDKVAGFAGVNRRTLHRHFKDRAALLEACSNEMMDTWQAAMLAAYESSDHPIKQLELMLYAGIDCGVKYAFLDKLQHTTAYRANPAKRKNKAYENARAKWFALIPELQQQGIISDKLSAAWIRVLFSSMITTTIAALKSGDIAPNDVKKFAWYSYRRSIGIK